jgi:hypothetical protein
MTDLSATIIPRSDQINSDDLIAGPRTITITRVTADPGSAEQPIAIYFDGDGGKPYKPCKSMRRVMVSLWGADGGAYTGRSMTLYRDPKVQFGGMAVGGIRISHMTHIDHEVTLALTASKAKRANFVVRPLAMQKATQPKLTPEQVTDRIVADIKSADIAALDAILTGHAKTTAWLSAKRPDLHARIIAAADSRRAPTDDEFPDFDSASLPTTQTASAGGDVAPHAAETPAEAPHSIALPVATFDQQVAFLAAFETLAGASATGDEMREWERLNEKKLTACAAAKSHYRDMRVRLDAVRVRLDGEA